MECRPQVILIDGITGSGKSTAIEHIERNYQNYCSVVKKTTSRAQRNNQDDNHYFGTVLESNPDTVSYWDVGEQYAIDLRKLRFNLTKGKTSVLVCTSNYARRRLREEFDVVTIYVFRTISERGVRDLMVERNVENTVAIDARIYEYQKLLDDYIESVTEYEVTILNIGELSKFVLQLDTILGRFGCKNG